MPGLIEERRSRRSVPEPAKAKAILQAADVTQQLVADELGVHVITVYRWLAGQRRPRGELAEKYRRLLQDLAALVAEEQGK